MKQKQKNIRYALIPIMACFILFSGIAHASPTSNSIKVKSGAPPGFREEVAEYYFVDVYYNKAFITRTRILVENNTVRVLNAGDILNALPEIRGEMIGEIEDKLNTPSPFNSAYSCYPQTGSSCNMLPTNSLELVYNPNTLTLEVVVNNDIFVDTSNGKIYLDAQSDDFSQFFKFNATGYWSDAKNIIPIREDYYNIYLNSKTLFRGYTLNANLNYIDSRDNVFFDDIYLIRYNKKSNLKIGELNTADLRSLNQANLLGISLKSSTERRRDDSVIFSSPISVYLNYRSTINIIKDGRIYSSKTYDSGTQFLDTSILPWGSYNIELEIIEPNGNKRRETQFFVKNSDIPPTSELNYWLEFGAIQDNNGSFGLGVDDGGMFNGYENEYLARLGLYKRLFKSTALGGNVVLNRDISGLEVFTEYFSRYLTLRASVGMDTESSYGYNLFAQLNNSGNLFFYASWTQNFLEKAEDNFIYRPIGNYFKNGNANIKYYFLKSQANVGFTASYYEDTSRYKIYSIGPELEYNINNFKNTNMRLMAGVYKTQNDYRGQINFTVNFNSKHLQLYNNSTYRGIKERDSDNSDIDYSFDSSTALTLQTGGVYNQDARLTFRYDDIEDVHTKSAELDYKNRLARFVANVSTNENIDQASINLSSIFAFNRNSTALGGKQQHESAIALRVDGGSRESFFDIYANNIKVDQIRGDSKTVLNLSPFSEYNINIKPQESSQDYLEGSASSRIITLYPGSMHTVEYRAKSTVILIATIYSKYGETMSNTVIKGEVDETMTDENGNFQIVTVIGEDLEVEGMGRISIPKGFGTGDNRVIFIDMLILKDF